MAAVPDVSKNVSGSFTATSIVLATSGDTLTYSSGTEQLLVLYNIHATDPAIVTIDGASGTTVAVPGAGATTASVAAGYAITIAAGVAKAVRLDTISAYLSGTVSIVSDTAAIVVATIVH